jgi:DNA-binding MarR family transcriptional regulator
MTPNRAAMSLSRLLEMPGHRIRRCHQLVVGLFMAEVGALDVTPVQFAALTAIAASPDIDATRLAAIVALDRSTLGLVLERLEARRLIVRRMGETDRRTKRMRVTNAGKTLIAKADPAVERSQERFLAVLEPAKRELLLGLLADLVTHHSGKNSEYAQVD